MEKNQVQCDKTGFCEANAFGKNFTLNGYRNYDNIKNPEQAITYTYIKLGISAIAIIMKYASSSNFKTILVAGSLGPIVVAQIYHLKDYFNSQLPQLPNKIIHNFYEDFSTRLK